MPHNDSNRYSNEMKDEILIILAEVSLHEKDIETAQQELLDLFLVSKLSISEHDKMTMAGEWSRSRSEGDREQDRQCNYDFVMGMEAAIKKLNAR